MADRKKIVIIGATGHFGSRICHRIASEPNTSIVVTSRSLQRARRFVCDLKTLYPGSALEPAALDHGSRRFGKDLESIEPDIVLHTAGPYQGQDYGVAQACIQCGSHYIDLADGRAFVEGFSSLDCDAKKAGLLLVTGASTLPGLSSAVVDALQDQFAAIHEVQISIAPAHQTPRGLSTIAAVMSYCGKAFSVLSEGQWVRRYGWQDLRIQRYPGLGRRLSAACDVPDLALMPKYYSGLQTMTFHAALEVPWEQITLWLMGWLTRLKIIENWQSFAPAFQRISRHLTGFGSTVGGMHIRLSGLDAARRPIARTWFLLAKQNHGPEIPCSPALILTRKLIRDEILQRGAMPCMHMISLREFANEVSDLAISWQITSH